MILAAAVQEKKVAQDTCLPTWVPHIIIIILVCRVFPPVWWGVYKLVCSISSIHVGLVSGYLPTVLFLEDRVARVHPSNTNILFYFVSFAEKRFFDFDFAVQRLCCLCFFFILYANHTCSNIKHTSIGYLQTSAKQKKKKGT